MVGRHGTGGDIAIVGMAIRVPGARSISEYWTNLREGVCAIRELTRDQLLAAGESPERIARPSYVPHAATLDGFDRFDAEFFGFGPKEAAILDPQHRQFLEAAWEALESAGHPPERFGGAVGVYASCGMGSYFYFNVCSHADLVAKTGLFLLRHTGNDKDFLATRVSHVLDLKGPSLAVQTACSSSLVATHYACKALRDGDCDLALSGGVTIELPHGRGYLYKEGEILSPDGRCHAFDHRAQGTVFGSGVAVVALRRLEDALADGDPIFAVIKGTAVNNDGADKAGYLAPSVDGQARAVSAALAAAEVAPETIGYVECHGTGTYLGDPIEIAALTSAFGPEAARAGACRIGSVKTNIGHLDTAAGVASLIKAALALHHGAIPPSLGYEAPNPAIDVETSPFRVADRLTPWSRADGPRRAGVNSLGVGGTNAFAVLEEAPPRAASEPSDWPFQPIVVSGRTRAALDANAKALAAHLRAHPEQPLADVAYTLIEGRRAFARSRVLVAGSHEEAAALLERNEPRRVFTHERLGADPEVVFMFPGGGAQHAGMARGLYETEPVFKDWVDKGLAVLQPKLDYDVRRLWLPEPAEREAADERLRRPSVQLPLIMIVEVALAQLWMSWGVRPSALIGHSMGENAAACVAGVMSFEDCIDLVHLRGTLFDGVPAGGMLSVPLSAEALAPLLGESLDLASVNAPGACVASGPQPALDALEAELRARDVEAQRIPIDIAAHSRMLEPVLERFRAHLRGMRLSPPRVPVISNRTGAPLTDEQATDPDYWVGHLRNTVRFADGIATLSRGARRVYLEVGPGRALCSLAQANGVAGQQALSSLRHPDDPTADDAHFLGVVARLAACGVRVDWDQIWGGARRDRVVLPTYAFQGERYFIERAAPRAEAQDAPLTRKERIEDWGWRPVWRPRLAPCPVDVETGLGEAPRETWLVFADEAGLASRAVARLRQAGHRVVEVRAGDAFARIGEDAYRVSPEHGREGYDALVRDLAEREAAPTRIAHFWLVTRGETFRPGSSFLHRNQEQGFYSLLFLAQALAAADGLSPCHIAVFTSGATQVRAEPLPYPEKATVMGPARVIPREMPGVGCSVLDVELPDAPARRGLDRAARAHAAAQEERLATAVLEEMLAEPSNAVAALRGAKRLELGFAPAPLAPAETPPLREGGVVLVTGGLGGIGLTIAESLAREARAKLVLVGRTPLPPRETWKAQLRWRAETDPLARRIRAVERLEALGAQVLVLAADVTDEEEMRAALATAKARFGAVDAVIHAAGVLRDGPLLAKTVSAVEDVFTPKIYGAAVLDRLFPDGSIDWMALFSSVSTITAPAGQVDYVAANEYLNAFAKARSGGRTRVVAIDWGVWSEIGMAADALGPRAGQSEPGPFAPVSAPLLDEMRRETDGARVFRAAYDARERWVLDGHRIRDGAALAPGTSYLEMAAEALAASGDAGPFAIADLVFLRPLVVGDDARGEVRVRLAPDAEGIGFEVRSACMVDGRAAFAPNAQGRLSLAPPPARERVDLDAVAARCGPARRASGAEALRAPQEDHLAFGPRWQVLRAMAFGTGEGLAELSLPEAFHADLGGGWRLHPALLDIATGWAMELIDGYAPTHLWAPLSYRCVAVHADLPARVFSWARSRPGNRAESGFATFDVTLCDDAGAVLMEVEGFTLRRLEVEATLAVGEPPKARDVVFETSGEAERRLSPGEEQLAAAVEQGIRPDEGADAFARALAAGAPQVVVSSLDLDGLVRQAARAGAKEPGEAQSFARPDLDSAYVAPRNEIERTLVGFWEELLGVAQIGVEDSFFDLGGHSLVAVRLFVMIKKAFRAEFPISVLFEAPTIAGCAALIAEHVGGDAASEPGEAVPAASAPRRHTHLVAMHEGRGGPSTPVFMVAGMFGNVLNLRHLALRLGTDRPFWGLQARGLLGGAAPHETIPEAARDLITEMRLAQPHGPYIVGGFSGGGITAYEIARQLEAEGERVSLLIMLDTPLPTRPSLTRRDRALIKWQELRERGARFLTEWVRRRAAWELGRVRASLAQPTERETHAFHDDAIEAAFRRAVAAYALEPWNGNAALFRPPLDRRWRVSGGRFVDGEREYVFDDNEWTPWIPALRVFEVPGDHDSMVLEPHARILAARIRACIAQADSDRERPHPADVAAAFPAAAE
ncbi:SDR family NAD(P)-dependent oxidoreductase [Salinarimonas sp.]|uniref:type I polyketide synthase n=1 Tax=Salinarimonas sp. TaxID=2766526 RepID=UPI0032D938D7